MDHKPLAGVVTTLEPLLQGVSQLEIVLGPAAVPYVQRARQRLLEALAARDRGDPSAAFDAIGRAMAAMTELAGVVDPGEAVLMRAIADGFQRALRRGDHNSAEQQAAVMMQRSGAVERKNKA